jgi:hypothetical protein
MKKVLEKNEHLMQKQQAAINEKMGGRNDHRTSLHSKFVRNVFVFYYVCYNMSEENVIEKL